MVELQQNYSENWNSQKTCRIFYTVLIVTLLLKCCKFQKNGNLKKKILEISKKKE